MRVLAHKRQLHAFHPRIMQRRAVYLTMCSHRWVLQEMQRGSVAFNQSQEEQGGATIAHEQPSVSHN
eukprot:4367719-Amphidinium_carterae.1